MGKVIATFVDKFGEEQSIHRDKNGLKVKRKELSPVLHINQVIAIEIGKIIKKLRQQRGLSLEELCIRSGLRSSWPKQRMWEIENGTRIQGLRLGTLYVIAKALDVPVCDLLPQINIAMKTVKIVKG